MKRKWTRLHTLWVIVITCIAVVFVTTTLIPSLIPFIMTGKIPMDSTHIMNSDFWMMMSFFAVLFVGAFTLLYWYIKEHHMHDE